MVEKISPQAGPYGTRSTISVGQRLTHSATRAPSCFELKEKFKCIEYIGKDEQDLSQGQDSSPDSALPIT